MKWILGVTAVAVIVGVVATMTVPAQTITPDEATLKLFPSETTGIASIDVAGLRGAPLFNDLIMQKLPARLPREMNEFVQATGFDIARDVDKITAGRIGPQEGLVIVQARYDHFKVEQFIQDKADDVRTETYLGRVIYTGDGDRNSAHASGVSFIDNLIIAGNLAAVKQAIDRMVPSAPPSVIQNTELMDDIRTIEAGNQLWAVGKLDLEPMVHSASPEKIQEVAGSLKSGTYAMRLDQDVHVKATGTFGSVDMAKAAGDTLRGFVAMAKLQVSQEENLSRLLDGLSIENSGENMTLTFNATGDLLKQIQEIRGFPKFGH
jgi:hypothetical protein